MFKRLIDLFSARSTILILATSFVSIAAVVGYLMHAGYKMCEGDLAKSDIKGVKIYAKLDDKVKKLDNDSLHKRATPWVR